MVLHLNPDYITIYDQNHNTKDLKMQPCFSLEARRGGEHLTEFLCNHLYLQDSTLPDGNKLQSGCQ